MTEYEILNEVNELLASRDFIIFDRAFFDDEVPKAVNDFRSIEQVDKLIIWLRNRQSEPRCLSKGTGEMTGKYLFNTYKDPIIQFDIGRTIDKLVSPSRLYYKFGWIADDELRELHGKLTTKIVRSFKKKLITSKRLKPFYISEGINKRLDEGYEVELGKGGMRVSKLELNGT
ncbi:hypothetical protein [Aridibaculum aurantiacum]|uniref:hypothetical protein n=1 Tax=Aridibaculum aurantiacum TaxID=2810307 RepID=UPI001A97C484|nr:hypothetical protein [Aridibaculum aurantiacum]